jgi:amino acid transporter
MLFILVFIFIFFNSLMYNKYSHFPWKENTKRTDYAFSCAICMNIFILLIFYG